MLRKYIQIIKDALSDVKGDYFLLLTTYNHSGIVRERMFCYELYHQIRIRMENNDNLLFCGEIDKRGHPDFERRDRKNPDFVFHIPETHEGNTIVIEVKGTLDSIQGIVKDFNTLNRFTSKYRYPLGLFILYNHNSHELTHALGEKLNEIKAFDSAENIIILTIEAPNAPIEELTLLELSL